MENEFECAGLDIGSRSIELVLLRSGKIELSRKLPTTFNPLKQCALALAELGQVPLVATGYGRKLFVKEFENSGRFSSLTDITEIQAHALGAMCVFPEARTVLDIGGQDTKVVSLGPDGRVIKFEMNDRCAAGTGKFLEFMATALQLPLEDFGDFALKAERRVKISSMCTVFAETEATTLMALGESPENIALGLHLAIADRVWSMAERVGLRQPFVFTGGVARNACMVKLLAERLGEAPLIPENPDFTGALGAAIYAAKNLC